MDDRLDTSSKSNDRGTKGASNSPRNPSGTLAFDNWSYPTYARPESSTQRPPYPSTYKQPVPVGYSPQPAVGFAGQTTRPGSTRLSPAERTLRAPQSPQTLLAFRERSTPSNVNQQPEKGRGRRNESPTTFLSRILSEPRPFPFEKRQSTKEKQSGRGIERAEMNGSHSARLASSRWERGGGFTPQLDKVSQSALANVPAGTSTQPSTGAQMSGSPRQGHLSDEYIHPARRVIMASAVQENEYSAAVPVSESEGIGIPPGAQPETSTNMLPAQARKILPVSRPRPQPTTYPIPTYPKPTPAPGAKPLHSSSNPIPIGPCGNKRAQGHPESPPSKRSKTIEEIRRVEAENKRLLLENKSIQVQIQRARDERLRQEALKQAAQKLQLRALEIKNAKLKQDNIELKLQLERNTQNSDVREGSRGRSVVAVGPTAARLLPNVAKSERQIKLHLGIRAASESPRPVQALRGASLEKMEVEIQSGEKINTAMVKARNSTRPEGEKGKDMGPERLVKVEADEMTEAPFYLDFTGTGEVDIKMEDF
ncbi:hypothetical protein L211DRAFT_898917 [Terfezia boudieri ATCC MYA-4762]|uniref:Uncharacterized protein n=1 Tax=Terfezia boudieri ATCC MYA-4762 TaxID=1051890 RepID=A0A3N4LVG9_9PEZI|nr:hypothetical protein L211DRAFT_898917 [Terfezia boudieri ATCC MYA-4762]